jgi:hypothetical protein
MRRSIGRILSRTKLVDHRLVWKQGARQDQGVTTKEAILETIRKLPDNVTIEDVMAEFYFRQKVDEGLKELDEGKGIPHDQARERLQKWLK